MAKPKDADFQKLQWLLSRLSRAETYCQPYFERSKRHYKLYRFGSGVEDKDWPYVNRVRSRDIQAFVEDTTALMVQTLFGTVPFYNVIPRETTIEEITMRGIDTTKIASQLEKCLEYQVHHEDTEFLDEMVDFFKGGHIFGTGYVGVYPKFVDGVYMRPLIRTIDYWDVIPITNAKRISRTRGVFVREWLTKEEVLQAAGEGKFQNGDELQRLLTSSSENKWHAELLAEAGIENYDIDPDEIEVLHYFSGGHVITIAARAVILRDSKAPVVNQLQQQQVVKPFPFDQPIVQYKYNPLPNEWFGMGIPEILEVLQEDKNLVRSARRDNIDLVINKIILAKANADINFDLIKHYPGAIWPLENLNDIAPYETSDVTQSAYLEEDKIRFDMENALSMFGYARGMTPTHEERPTTVIKLQQAALNRLDLAVKLAEFNSLQQIATRIILLTRRYMPPQVYQAITGEPDAGFYRLSEEEVRRFFEFRPVGSSVTHVKEIRQQQVAFALQVLQQMAMVGPYNPEPFLVNFLPAVQEALKVADIKNSDQMILTKPKGPPVQMMPNQMEMQQLQQVPYGAQQ